MPHFSLMAQPSRQVVEGMEKHPASLEESLTGASASQETCRRTPCVVHPHLSLMLCTILEEAASPGGLWELSHQWRGESLTYLLYLLPFPGLYLLLGARQAGVGQGEMFLRPQSRHRLCINK